MKLIFKFRQIPWSEEMVEYTTHRLEKLGKFEWQPFSVYVTFREEGHHCCVEMRLSGRGVTHKAKVLASAYTECVDSAISKLQRQLDRKKSLIQSHMVYENTRFGKIERQEVLDPADEEMPTRKTG